MARTSTAGIQASDSVIGCGGIQLKLPAAAGAVPIGDLGPEKQTPSAPGPGAPWVPRAVTPTGRRLQLKLQQWVEHEASFPLGLATRGNIIHPGLVPRSLAELSVHRKCDPHVRVTENSATSN